MKFVPIVIASLGTLLCAGVLAAAAAQEKGKGEFQKKAPDSKSVVYVSADKAEYKPVIPGVSRAVLTGDPEKGAYQAFTKFEPGATHALHTHPHDVDIVVLKGAYVYKPEKGEGQRVGPGGFLHLPAGDRHVSGGDAKEGALFYEASSGKFGVDFVEKEKEKEKK